MDHPPIPHTRSFDLASCSVQEIPQIKYIIHKRLYRPIYSPVGWSHEVAQILLPRTDMIERLKLLGSHGPYGIWQSPSIGTQKVSAYTTA